MFLPPRSSVSIATSSAAIICYSINGSQMRVDDWLVHNVVLAVLALSRVAAASIIPSGLLYRTNRATKTSLLDVLCLLRSCVKKGHIVDLTVQVNAGPHMNAQDKVDLLRAFNPFLSVLRCHCLVSIVLDMTSSFKLDVWTGQSLAWFGLILLLRMISEKAVSCSAHTINRIA